DPDQRGQRSFEIHVVAVSVSRLSDSVVDEIRKRAGNQHHDAHDEDPDQQLHLNLRIRHAEQDERDQRHAGNAIGLKAVGARTDRIASIVTGAVRDYAGFASVIFLDLEHDLHQVGTYIGDLGEDSSG